jgi:DNA-binding CsgD family transcriptional regulator
MANLAWPTMTEGSVDDDLVWLARAVDAAARAGDPKVKRAVDGQRATILLSIGDPDGWGPVTQVPQSASSTEEQAQLLRYYHSLALVTMNLGHYGRAESYLAEAIRIDDQLEHFSWGPWLQSTRIALDWRAGRWEGLESRARELLEVTAARPALALANELNLGSVLLARGRVQDAERTFASALEVARHRGWMSAHILATAKLALIRLAEGEPQAAGEMADAGLDVVRRKGIWVWARELAPVATHCLLACGELEQAGRLVEEFSAGLRDRDAPAARAANFLCQGSVLQAKGRHDAGARLLSRAERLWSELPSPYEAARSRERRAHCLLARGDERGGDLLLDALQTYEGLGATWDAGRARAELRTLRVDPRARAQRWLTAFGDVLSPREAEVAHLAGMGRKNREIAEALFLSPRTVEAHVASVLRKLGVDSRHDLAAVALEEATRTKR